MVRLYWDRQDILHILLKTFLSNCRHFYINSKNNPLSLYVGLRAMCPSGNRCLHSFLLAE